MSLFRRERSVEIVAASGTLRVAVHPKPAWLALAFETAATAAFIFFVLRGWSSIALWNRALLAWVVATSVVGLFWQLSGSEIIEFDSQKLSVTKEIFGWNRTTEYAIEKCRELEWRDQEREAGHYGLQCKVGWRTIKFGRGISEDESIEILTGLQRALPEVAQQIFATSGAGKDHFTTLKLS